MAFKNPKSYPNVRKELLKEILKFEINKLKIKKEKEKIPFATEIKMWQYKQEELIINPTVSVIIRTHKRKEALKLTLSCLRNQIYKNFEIVIVEDGEKTAESIIKSEFLDMNINYYATIENKGRSAAGNIGMQRARGEYICFLDDDDFLYPDFISSNIMEFQKNPDKKYVFSSFISLNTDLISNQPYQFKIKSKMANIFSHITLIDMCVKCRVPITGVMFKRELFLKYGGMREDLNADEDWQLWLKFIANTNKDKYLKEVDIKRCISVCIYPADEEIAKKREENYAVFDEIMLRDESLVFTVKKEEIEHWKQTIRGDVLHLYNNNILEDFLKNIKPLGENDIDEEKGEYSAFEINNYYYFLLKKYADELI